MLCFLQGTAGPGSSSAPQSALQGISGIKVDPKDFEETTKRRGNLCWLSPPPAGSGVTWRLQRMPLAGCKWCRWMPAAPHHLSRLLVAAQLVYCMTASVGCGVYATFNTCHLATRLARTHQHCSFPKVCMAQQIYDCSYGGVWVWVCQQGVWQGGTCCAYTQSTLHWADAVCVPFRRRSCRQTLTHAVVPVALPAGARRS